VSWVRLVAGGIELEVQVVPRASRTRVVGSVADRLKIQLNAPPVDGEANAALVELLAETFGVRKSAVTIVAGETSRKKRVRIEGATEAQAQVLISG